MQCHTRDLSRPALSSCISNRLSKYLMQISKRAFGQKSLLKIEACLLTSSNCVLFLLQCFISTALVCCLKCSVFQECYATVMLSVLNANQHVLLWLLAYENEKRAKWEDYSTNVACLYMGKGKCQVSWVILAMRCLEGFAKWLPITDEWGRSQDARRAFLTSALKTEYLIWMEVILVNIRISSSSGECCLWAICLKYVSSLFMMDLVLNLMIFFLFFFYQLKAPLFLFCQWQLQSGLVHLTVLRFLLFFISEEKWQ